MTGILGPRQPFEAVRRCHRALEHCSRRAKRPTDGPDFHGRTIYRCLGSRGRKPETAWSEERSLAEDAGESNSVLKWKQESLQDT